MRTIKISVRQLVEFILRSGDLTSSSGIKDPDAMQEGTRIHKKIQRMGGADYRAEVALSILYPVEYDGINFEICLEGRADGIFTNETGVNIDEIKGIYRELSTLKEPVPVHLAQACCYAYIYATDNELEEIGIRMTYCYIPTEEIRYFYQTWSYKELKEWFDKLLMEYAKWAAWQIKWEQLRDKSIKGIEFPFEYREGQNNLVKGVYQTILRKKRLYIEAPTGVGKTISTVFPTVKAMGEGIIEKIFYLTAKTITRTVAEDTFHILEDNGAKIKYITITAKEKICILDKPQCNPESCERAKGHFDRVNDAVFDLINNENFISREKVLEYAEKHMVCPFEMSLDVSLWADAIIGDYNYVFDPTASLKRFFANEKQNEYAFLIDEAHNLVDRAREMYSATVVKERFLDIKRVAKLQSKKLTNALEACNRSLLTLKRECEELVQYDMVEIEDFVIKLMRLISVFDEFFQKAANMEKPLNTEARDKFLDFYFEIRNFNAIYEIVDDKYIIYADYNEDNEFCLHLKCMDPSTNLNVCLEKGRASVFFSATFLPIKYYMEQLAGREDDYAVYAPSPFSTDNRLLMIGSDVSSKYTRRGPLEYEKIADYIYRFTKAKLGNYMVFFPSYKMMQDISHYIMEKYQRELDDEYTDERELPDIYEQSVSMNEIQREEFLANFEDSPERTTIGLCVMGGIFGEGIDLKDNRLIGVVIVGTGLPMVCVENELFKQYFDEKKGNGFCYAYQYPAMNKVLQAAGRVIRTDTDRGAILLLDERFTQRSYQELFPREWYPHERVTRESMGYFLDRFWRKKLV